MRKLAQILVIAAVVATGYYATIAFGFPRGGSSASSSPALIMPAANNIQTNWQDAGLLSVGGIPNRTTQCGSTVSPSGITPPATGDDADNINAAITACTTGDYVQLAAGTSSAITASISGTTLTVTSGSGEAIKDVLGGANVLPGTMITGGSGTTWTVNMSQTIGSESMVAVVPFLISSSEYIALNKEVSLRGTGSCNNAQSPYCGSVIEVYDGAIADWSISSTTAGGNCGVSSGSASGCTTATGAILVSPSGVYAWGWSGSPLGAYNPTTGGFGTTLSADAAQGAYTVSVSSTANFSVGMWVLIDESPQVVSTTNPTGGAAVEASAEWASASSSPVVMLLEGGDIPGAYSFIGSGGGSQENQRLNQEIHQIASIGSGTLTFTSPLSEAFRQSGSHDARVYWPTQNNSTANPFLVEAGVENLTIYRPGNSGVQFTFCAECWMKDVEVGGWVAGAVNTDYSVRTQIDSNYLHDGYDLENNGNEYPIGISSASTETYVVNNIILHGGKGMVGRGACCSVVAYNYVDQEMYMQAVIGDYWRDMSLNGSHYAGTHHFLFEGNWADSCDSDETHGDAVYHTFFRNDCTGIRTTFTDISNRSLTVNDTSGSCYGTSATPTSCGPLRAAGPMGFDYNFAFLSNVLGLAGVTTTSNGWVYRGAFSGGGGGGGLAQNKAIWMSGWTGSEWPAPDPNLTTTSNPFIFRNGNYDYVDAGIVDNASGYSQSFPTSLYLSAQPSFMAGTNCTYPWPGVTPTAGSPLQPPTGIGCSSTDWNPAKARWDAGTPFVQP